MPRYLTGGDNTKVTWQEREEIDNKPYGEAIPGVIPTPLTAELRPAEGDKS